MFLQVTRTETLQPVGADPVARPGSPMISDLSPRALHARLLSNAAARRLRAVEREQADRRDDALYWKAGCPIALRKAAALREERSFAPLP